MKPKTSPPYLRLIKPHEVEPTPVKQNRAPPDGKQSMLFSDASQHTLGFIKAADLSAERMVDLIAEAKPKYIFDVRPTPTFAKGELKRSQFFRLIESHGVQYYDVAGVLGVSSSRDARLNPVILIDTIQVSVLRSAKGLTGPIFFFLNEELFTDDYFTEIADQVEHQDGRGWDIACWPNYVEGEQRSKRDLIFISHANPEDNDVARWLGARLATQGYEVWSDVTRLLGGELFWDTIEEAIRVRSAKVIVLLSKRGHLKSGLLDEVNIAISTERTEKLNRFVIPVRIDELPFSEVRANLARKNVLDGSKNLADAYHELLKVFDEDSVPKNHSVPDDSIANALFGSSASTSGTNIDLNQWDKLIENRIEVFQWPVALRKFAGRKREFSSNLICHPVSGGYVTFASWAEIESACGGDFRREGEAVFSPSDLSTPSALLSASSSEIRRAVTHITKHAWEAFCSKKGLQSFRLASGSNCWYFKTGFRAGNKVKYVDSSGTERTKLLVGKSHKRGVYWHFALEPRIDLPGRSIRLVPHVVFSLDGLNPLPQPDKQHSLRRGFCKSWWNARWRDLLIASLSTLNDGREAIELSAGQEQVVRVSGNMLVHSPNDVEAVRRAGRRYAFSIPEPCVKVGFDQTSDDPKDGLAMFGPLHFSRNPKSIRVGAIGTTEGLELFKKWSSKFNSFRHVTGSSGNSLPFPGFEAAFNCKWNGDPLKSIALSKTDVVNSILLSDRHQAIFKTVGLFADAISAAVKTDDLNVDIWFVVVPDEVFLYGRPASRVPRSISIAMPHAMGRKAARKYSARAPSLFEEDNAEAQIYDHHLDFHHQLKARLLKQQLVTQVLRESSLAVVTSTSTEVGAILDDSFSDEEEEAVEPVSAAGAASDVSLDSHNELGEFEKPKGFVEDSTFVSTAPFSSSVRHMQDSASFSWNLGTASFFKAGGRPWKVASAREGVCYIGLIFKRKPGASDRNSCCGAQMFLGDSDGLVFKGAMGPWFSPDTKEFHLDRSEARKMISAVMQSYASENGQPPREIFIHGRTRFSEDEWLGFCESIDPEKTTLTGVRITRSNEYKLFSSGELAVKRGTAILESNRVALLWTTGYVDRLQTYPGRETPNPLRVEVVKSSTATAKIETVLNDIMSLTKMNFNSCLYSDGVPVTMRFADAIGDVLVTAIDDDIPPLPFRYYI